MKRWGKFSILAILSFFVLLFYSGTNNNVQAAEAMVKYGVKPIFPDNQKSKDVVFFDLKMEPGQKQVVEVEVKNTDSEPIEVEVNTNAAFTNINGVITYVPESKQFKFDSTLKHPFSKLGSAAPKVTVPGNQVITVPITIAMPSEETKGTILGGIEFKQSVSNDAKPEKNKSSGGMAIRNQYRYIIPVKITESDEVVKPELKLNKVRATQLSFRNVIIANLQNTKPTIVNGLRLETKVTRAGSDKVLFKNDNSDMQVAPNTNFNYPISLGNQPFKPGKYTLYMVATAKEGKWQFKKDFTITREEANKYNKESAIDLEKTTNWWLIIGIAVAVLLVLGCIVWLIIKQRKKKQSSEKAKTSNVKEKSSNAKEKTSSKKHSKAKENTTDNKKKKKKRKTEHKKSSRE